MARKSKIARLPPEVRAALDAAIRDGGHTLDELVAMAREEFGTQIARSTLGDYAKRMGEKLERLRATREMSDVWVGKLGTEPDSKVAALVADVLHMVAFNASAELADLGEQADPGAVLALSRALDHLSKARKTDHEHRARLRAEFQAEMKAKAEAAATEAKQVAKRAGLSDEAANDLRRIVFGMVG